MGIVLANGVSFGCSGLATGSVVLFFCSEALFDLIFRFLLTGGGLSRSAECFPRGVFHCDAGSFGFSRGVLVMGSVVDLFYLLNYRGPVDQIPVPMCPLWWTDLVVREQLG